MERLAKLPNGPETIKYFLGFDNNILQLSAHFDKNPVGTYDYTVCHFTLQPLISFALPVTHIMLNFSEETLNKVHITQKNNNRRIDRVFGQGAARAGVS